MSVAGITPVGQDLVTLVIGEYRSTADRPRAYWSVK